MDLSMQSLQNQCRDSTTVVIFQNICKMTIRGADGHTQILCIDATSSVTRLLMQKANKYLASFNQFLKQTTSLDMNTKNVYALPGLNCINQIQLSGRRAGSWVQTIKKALRITRICPRVTPCITWFHLECQRPGSMSLSSNLQEGLKLQKYE